MRKIFISHSSEDEQVARQIINLLHAGLNVPRDWIRCTSVDGYRLAGGAETEAQLRRELREAKVLLAIVSERSLRSAFVLFELGARWGGDELIIPLLVRGMSASSLPAPLAGYHAVRSDSQAELHKLVEDLGKLLSLKHQGGASIQEHCEIIAGVRPDDNGAGNQPTRADLPKPIGAIPEEGATSFRVWAADHQKIELVITSGKQASSVYELGRGPDGCFTARVPGVVAGDRYGYRLAGWEKILPDPASRHQPVSVHAESAVVDPGIFTWTDQQWAGLKLEDLVIYEVHVGTATDEGTFDSLITRLGMIRDLGVTAIMLMAVADFPGTRNWGYEGVDLFAPARAYGGPEALRRLVDAAHARQLGVILDVVFNHVGPEGNYLTKFSRSYFTDKHKTPWGDAFNYISRKTGAPVCDFVVANACHWVLEYHVDGIRLDAINAIHDDDAPNIVSKITTAVKKVMRGTGREVLVIAEDDTNDPRMVLPPPEGYGLDAVYADDFHHQLHIVLTGERSGYYKDYKGTTIALADAIGRGWSLVGHESEWRKDENKRPRTIGFHGAEEIDPMRFVWCIQNHDQVGNRPGSQRLNMLVSEGAYRAASALLLLAPYTPLLFMGQEWAAQTPFHFFVDRENSEGHDIAVDHRRHMLEMFPGANPDAVPDPRAEQTFLDSKLRWAEAREKPHRQMREFYRTLLRLRSEHLALRHRARGSYSAVVLNDPLTLALTRGGTKAGSALLLVLSFKNPLKFDLNSQPALRPPAGYAWRVKLDSEHASFGGSAEATLSSGTIVDMPGPGALLLEAGSIS